MVRYRTHALNDFIGAARAFLGGPRAAQLAHITERHRRAGRVLGLRSHAANLRQQPMPLSSSADKS
jgi:hypothetical protein